MTGRPLQGGHRLVDSVFAGTHGLQCLVQQGVQFPAQTLGAGFDDVAGAAGGENAPYLWVQFPAPKDSWDWFDRLLNECGVICTPGAGFGAAGEGWLRFTAFGEPAATAEALRRIEVLL